MLPFFALLAGVLWALKVGLDTGWSSKRRF